MPLSCRRFLLRGCTHRDAARSAVEADAILVAILDRCVVDIVDSRDIHVVHGTVIEEVSAIPTASFISLAEVTEAVVNPAIKADFRPPVAVIEEIAEIAPAAEP